MSSVVGLVASWYIYRHRQHGRVVECVINHECDSIIMSRHNKIYGFFNDQVGLLYFGFSLLLSVLGIIMAGPLWVSLLILLSAFGASVYSGYLMYIQLRVLKHTCTWCLVPTIASFIILLAALGILV